MALAFNMADTRVLNFCKSLFSSRFSAIHVKSFRYFTRYLSSKASDFRVERDRVSFITEGCSIEELEKVQDLVVGNLEICEEFVSEEEEGLLLKEVEPYLKRQKYQYDHWDDVSRKCTSQCRNIGGWGVLQCTSMPAYDSWGRVLSPW